MRHFDITQWADYVRGLGSDTARQVMREHLEGGCSRCLLHVTTLRRMLETRAADARLDPPAHVMKGVKALFALDVRAARSLLDRLLLTPTFDSALVPVPDGARSSMAQRHLAFEGGEFSLEVQLEEPAGERPGRVEGHLRRQTGTPVAHAAAHLHCDGHFAASGFTDEHGGFELPWMGEPHSELLLLGVDEKRYLVVDLDSQSP